MNESVPVCDTCLFFDRDGDESTCHRHAPAVQFERNYNVGKKRWLQSAYAIWPRVDSEDWCGEHQPMSK